MLETAEIELDDAVAWYRARDGRVADRFVAEMMTARGNIIAYPNAWHSLGDGLRRYRLNGFPYGLIYVVDNAEVLVIAVAHHSRRPAYWRDRIARE